MTNNSSYLKFFLAFLLLCFFVVLIQFLPSTPKIMMSYFVTEDKFSSVVNPQFYKDQTKSLNVLAYAFLHVNSEGKIIFKENDLWLTERNRLFCQQDTVSCRMGNIPPILTGDFDAFVFFEPSSLDLKKTISIGGADDKNSFFYAIRHIDRFVNSVNAVINEYHLAGIDLDFEINRPYKPEEAKLFTELVVKLRKKLGSSAVISLATIIDPETLHSLEKSNWKTIIENIDYVSMMCYDLISPFNKPYYTGFSSNLYNVSNAPKQLPNANMSCHQSILYLITLGVPSKKIVLGIPAYGIVFGSVSAKSNGLFQPFDPLKTPSFDDMGKGLLRYSTLQKLYDKGFHEYMSLSEGYIDGVWLYNPEKKEFVTFDNPYLVREKANYVLKNGLAGMMMWRVGQDVFVGNKNSLLRAMVEGLQVK